MGYKRTSGYGKYQTDWAKAIGTTHAHRLSYILFKNLELRDPKIVVRHKCDNPSCVNPDHLEEGTQADNTKDRDERGRHVPLNGVRNGNAKFTQEQTEDIRKHIAEGVPLKEIANQYDVHWKTISRLKVGKTYSTP